MTITTGGDAPTDEGQDLVIHGAAHAPQGFDGIVTRALEAWGQRISRRSAISRIAAGVLGGLAVSVFVEPRALAHNADLPEWDPSTWHNCTKWDRCKMCGYSCNCCNGDGDNPEDCPACAGQNPSNSWEGCCTNNSGVRKRIRYIDCHKKDCTKSKLRECYQCSGCNNACDHPIHSQWWKGPNQTYVCTAVVRLGDC